MPAKRSGQAAWLTEDADTLMQLFVERIRHYALVFMDLEGRITGWNHGGFCITGFTADDLLGQSSALLFTEEDVARELHVHELNGARLLGAIEDERWHRRKDGSRFWASGLTMLMHDNGQPRGFAKVFRDATHLRLRMDLLEDDVRLLKKDQQDRDVFLATIAHELRNPLQPMTVATTLLSRSSDPTLHDRALKVIRRQLGFMERLVEDLIDMTRMSQGHMTITYEETKLQPLLQEAADSMSERAAEKGVKLVCVLPPVPVKVEVDPGRVNQIVTNLLNNAIKFTPEGGMVSLVATVDENDFIVKVRDTGKGIGPELQPRIFDMFTQADGSHTGRGEGLGIGLALVKQLVSLHRGSVQVRSDGIGRGSEFSVHIPMRRPVG